MIRLSRMCGIPYRISFRCTFTPSLDRENSLILQGSSPPTTMGSADFSVSNAWSPRSPQVRAYSFTQYPLDLPVGYLMVSHPLDVSMMCYLIRPYWPLYPVPVRWNRALQSRFLHPMLHSKRACDLLILRGTTPAYKGLGFLRTLWNNLVSSIPDAHAGHTQTLK